MNIPGPAKPFVTNPISKGIGEAVRQEAKGFGEEGRKMMQAFVTGKYPEKETPHGDKSEHFDPTKASNTHNEDHSEEPEHTPIPSPFLNKLNLLRREESARGVKTPKGRVRTPMTVRGFKHPIRSIRKGAHGSKFNSRPFRNREAGAGKG